MKHLISSLAFSLLVGSFAAHADLPDLPVDGRIRILTYAPADVYTVPTKYGYQTSIVFASNEEITTVSVGDRSMWQIIPSGNRIFIRPMDDGLTTNMTVITNMREYNFDILSVEGEHSNNLYVVQFRYPDKRASTIADTLNDGEMPMTPPARFTPMAAPAPVASHVVIAPRRVQHAGHGPVHQRIQRVEFDSARHGGCCGVGIADA